MTNACVIDVHVPKEIQAKSIKISRSLKEQCELFVYKRSRGEGEEDMEEDEKEGKTLTMKYITTLEPIIM